MFDLQEVSVKDPAKSAPLDVCSYVTNCLIYTLSRTSCAAHDLSMCTCYES